MEIDMAKSNTEIGDLDDYLKRLGVERLKLELHNRMLAFESDTYDEDDKERDEDDDLESKNAGSTEKEIVQIREITADLFTVVNEGKAEIGDIRRRSEEMRLKLDLIQKNVLDITKELKEQFTGFDGLVFANQQLQEGMKEMKKTCNHAENRYQLSLNQKDELISMLSMKIEMLKNDKCKHHSPSIIGGPDNNAHQNENGVRD